MVASNARAARVGRTSGSMMCHQMRRWPQPSIFAASSMSRGMPFMNWRSRKMLNGAPNAAGSHSGAHVLYSPRFFQIRNTGIMVTCSGTMMVARMSTKTALRPGQLTRLTPYATSEEASSISDTPSTISTSELRTYSRTGMKSSVVR